MHLETGKKLISMNSEKNHEDQKSHFCDETLQHIPGNAGQVHE
jgi:hypothetical protein